MKKNQVRCLMGVVLGSLLLAGAARSTLASTNYVIYPFNTAGELTNDICAVRLWNSWNCDQSWVPSWTGSNPTNQWDSTRDAAGNPASGSLRAFFPWPGTGFQQAWNFVHMTTSQGPVNAAQNFDYIGMDMRIDPSSPVNGGGDYGQFLIASINLRTNGDLSISDVWADVVRLNPSVATVGSWVSYQGIPRSDQTNVGAFFIGLQGNNYDLVTPVIVNYDNLRFFTPPPPPPVMDIRKAAGGLEFVPAPTPSQQNPAVFIMSAATVYPLGPILNWMSYSDSGTANPTPVTYALTVSEFPDRAHSNYVAHMIFSPYATTPEGWRDHPENDLAHVLYVTITNNSDGTATASLQYKTNAPGSSTNWIMLGTVSSPTPLGAWSLTASNTALSLKAPGGSTANAALTDDVVALFNDGFTPLRAWLGVQPRLTNNFNQLAAFSSFKVSYVDSLTGVNVLTNETWSQDYTLNWAEATDSDGINPRPANTVYRISWTGPASGYSLQQNDTNVASSVSWSNTGLPASTSNDRKVSFVPSNMLPAGSANFYRLYNPNP